MMVCGSRCYYSCCFFKPKTEYDMRIRYWSSDVCSSALMVAADRREVEHRVEGRDLIGPHVRHIEIGGDIFDHRDREPPLRIRLRADLALGEIEQRGRASCRERVCQYV